MTSSRLSLRTIGSILVALTAALTAYYSSVYGIRLTVNEKADRAAVEQIDRRLVTIETVLKTDVAHRSDLEALRDEVRSHLNCIETLLQTSRTEPAHELRRSRATGEARP